MTTQDVRLTTLLQKRLTLLQQYPNLLTQSLRGIEKEGLRVDRHGRLSMTPHPIALGSALTHPHITTDYSEGLLELITDTHRDVDSLIQALDWVHRLAVDSLSQEAIWNHSMPATLPPEADIPIAWYGTSNSGMLKHVYRRGLDARYGKAMQCIAGLHYNFSFAADFWEKLDLPGDTPQTRQSAGYVSLIRNFVRHSWLLMYLFGASPAVSRDFIGDREHDLQVLDDQTLFLPWATSLRMSDFGYQNKAQSTLKPCYNDLTTFLSRLYDAVTTPWPAYEAIGTHKDGQWTQLNCNLLQIENEYYSTIRPKHTTARGERPITALAERGIQYVEVRCLDIDPFEPCGISAETARFMDAFLLFCALENSPTFGEDGFCLESANNFQTAVRQGRKPGLLLGQSGVPVPLAQWATQVLDQVQACAGLLAKQTGDDGYVTAVQAQHVKIIDPETTPSARVLDALKSQYSSFHEFGLNLSLQHTRRLSEAGLTAAERATGTKLRDDSLAAQKALESETGVSFEEYVTRFNEALKAPK
jgi:glutamate--cysteine ligase